MPLKATTVCDDPTPVAVLATATTSLTDQTCQPSADESSFALIPHSSLCIQPHPQETPIRSPTPHGVSIFKEEVDLILLLI